MDKLFGALSLTKRAGKLVAGYDAAVEAVLGGTAPLVLFAKDIAPRTEKNVREACEGRCSFASLPYTKDEIAHLTRKPAVVLAVADQDLAVLCRKALPHEEEPI